MQTWPCWVVLFACGSSPSPAQDGPSPQGDAPSTSDASGAKLALTSTVLTEGASFAAANTCDGANVSPDLAWTDVHAPSYAVVLTDQSIDLVHWILYDVHATSLAADVDKSAQPADVPGAHQTASYDSQTIGYLGPCPPAKHTYQFAVFALDVATLPGTPDRAQAPALIQQHMTATATLTGTYERP